MRLFVRLLITASVLLSLSTGCGTFMASLSQKMPSVPTQTFPATASASCNVDITNPTAGIGMGGWPVTTVIYGKAGLTNNSGKATQSIDIVLRGYDNHGQQTITRGVSRNVSLAPGETRQVKAQERFHDRHIMQHTRRGRIEVVGVVYTDGTTCGNSAFAARSQMPNDVRGLFSNLPIKIPGR